ncbi:hypothetical protein AOLI_G00151830 [Acnodon oligacanthus]
MQQLKLSIFIRADVGHFNGPNSRSRISELHGWKKLVMSMCELAHRDSTYNSLKSSSQASTVSTEFKQKRKQHAVIQ